MKILLDKRKQIDILRSINAILNGLQALSDQLSQRMYRIHHAASRRKAFLLVLTVQKEKHHTKET